MSRYGDGLVLPVPKENLERHPRMANMDAASLPFDGKRMFWGGFEVLVEK